MDWFITSIYKQALQKLNITSQGNAIFYLADNYNTVVSRASAHTRVSAHVLSFMGSLLQLPYKHMEFISRVSTHAGRNCELC